MPDTNRSSFDLNALSAGRDNRSGTINRTRAVVLLIDLPDPLSIVEARLSASNIRCFNLQPNELRDFLEFDHNGAKIPHLDELTVSSAELVLVGHYWDPQIVAFMLDTFHLFRKMFFCDPIGGLQAENLVSLVRLSMIGITPITLDQCLYELSMF